MSRSTTRSTNQPSTVASHCKTHGRTLLSSLSRCGDVRSWRAAVPRVQEDRPQLSQLSLGHEPYDTRLRRLGQSLAGVVTSADGTCQGLIRVYVDQAL